MNIEEKLQFVFVFVTGENTLTNELKKIYFASLPEFPIVYLHNKTTFFSTSFGMEIFSIVSI